MGEVIPMPSNNENALKLGDEALAKKDYESAVKYFEQVFSEVPNFAVARRLVNAYLGNNQPLAALPLISSYLDQWMSNVDDSEMIFSTLLAIPDIRFAWGLVPHAPLASQEKMSARIIAREEELKKTRGKEIGELERRLRHLGGLTPLEQEALIKELGLLPHEELTEAIKPNLTDPDVHPVVRVSLLDVLAAIGYERPVEFLTYEGQRRLIPAYLPGVWSDKTVLAVLQVVDEWFGDDEPELALATTEMLRFEVGYLYPFASEQIKSPEAFVSAYLGLPRPGDESTVSLIEWLHAQTELLGDSLQ